MLTSTILFLIIKFCLLCNSIFSCVSQSERIRVVEDCRFDSFWMLDRCDPGLSKKNKNCAKTQHAFCCLVTIFLTLKQRWCSFYLNNSHATRCTLKNVKHTHSSERIWTCFHPQVFGNVCLFKDNKILTTQQNFFLLKKAPDFSCRNIESFFLFINSTWLTFQSG